MIITKLTESTTGKNSKHFGVFNTAYPNKPTVLNQPHEGTKKHLMENVSTKVNYIANTSWMLTVKTLKNFRDVFCVNFCINIRF